MKSRSLEMIDARGFKENKIGRNDCLIELSKPSEICVLKGDTLAQRGRNPMESPLIYFQQI